MKAARRIKNGFYILEWAPGYRFREDLLGDLKAGFEVFTINIAEGISYAQTLLHLPATRGFLACFMPSFVYSILGRSPFMSVGPLALSSALTYVVIRNPHNDSIKDVAPGESPRGVEDIALLTLLVGVLTLITGLLKFGFMGNIISRTMMRAMAISTAIVVQISLIPEILGIKKFNGPFNTSGDRKMSDTSSIEALITTLMSLKNIHIPTTILSAVCILFLFMMARVKRTTHIKFLQDTPEILILFVVCISASILLEFKKMGISVLEMPNQRGLLDSLKSIVTKVVISKSKITRMFPSAMLITFLSFIETSAVSNICFYSHGIPVFRNEELIAFGASNIVGAFFGSWTVFGSLGRSMIKAKAGAKTPASELVSSILSVVSYLFFIRVISHLPKAVCGCVVMFAVSSLFKFNDIIFLYKSQATKDLAIIMATTLITVSISLEVGFFVSFTISLLAVVKNNSVLDIQTSNNKNDMTLTLWGSLAFYNADQLAMFVKKLTINQFQQIEKMDYNTPQDLANPFNSIPEDELTEVNSLETHSKVKRIIFDMKNVISTDYCTILTLFDITDLLDNAGIGFSFINVSEKCYEKFGVTGFSKKITSSL